MPNPSFKPTPSRINLDLSKLKKAMAPYPKSKQLHYDDDVARYFAQLEADGHDLSDWKYLLRSPGGIPPRTMIRFAKAIGAEIGDLLANGIGRNNSYDDVDRAVREHYQGHALGLVESL